MSTAVSILKRLVVVIFGLMGPVTDALATDPPPVLNTAAEIRNLSVDQANRHYPVHLQAVVTFYDDALFSRFVADRTAGIYLNEANVPSLEAGQLLDIEGSTSAGEYAPIVIPQRVRIVGKGELPSATRVTYDQVASGKEDSQFVEVEGIVRALAYNEASRNYVIELATGGGRVAVYTHALAVGTTNNLVDSTVRVRGVCSSQFNRQRQLFAIRLLSPRVEDLTVEIPAGADPYAIPERKIGSLFQFTTQGTYGHRVKISGAVTFIEPGSGVYLQNGSEGVFAQSASTNQLAVGDMVEVLGFAAPGQYTPALQDAVYRRTGQTTNAVPAPISRDEALKGNYDCRLVSIEAKMLSHSQVGTEQAFTLESDGFIFHAYQELTDGHPYSALEDGSRVAVSGICLVDPGSWMAGESWRAKTFRILMRSPQDLTVLEAPPWWTLQKMLWIAGALAFAVVVAFSWIAALRRRVNEQTHTIREQLEVEATLKERYLNLFENANDMVFTHDLKGRITSVNTTGVQLLQRSRDEILSVNLMDLLPPDQGTIARQWLDEIVKHSEPPTVELDFLNAGGQRFRLEISTRVIESDANNTEVESIGRDITERKRLEKEILEISNREQRRIGHDLHDGVCQQLAATAYLVDILADKLQERDLPESGDAQRIGTLVNQSITQTRNIARGLFPVKLEESGLPSALEDLANNTAALFKIDCRFKCDGPAPELENNIALHLYYIAQESVLNAARHGKAGHVSMSLSRANGSLILTVEDDGIGLKPPGSGQSTGMGIRIMRYRARVMGGTLDLKNRPGNGTQVRCELHLSPKSPKDSHE